MSNECKAVPVNCRQRLAAEGKPYPRSSCAACGQLSPNWRECESMLARPVPQPPALGDEVEIGIGSDEVIEELKMMADMADNNEDPDDHMMYMRWLSAIRSANAQVAPLQAEIEQLKSEIAAYKASRERLHGWIREEQLNNVHLKARCDDLESVMRDIRGANAAYALTKIDAALSKPAGSEQV